MKLLTGKTALITGGSDGIGSAIATACAQQGANLVLVGRDKQKLSQKENDLLPYSIDVLSISSDLSSNGAVQDVAGKIADGSLRVDILVNNAGIGRFIPCRPSGNPKISPIWLFFWHRIRRDGLPAEFFLWMAD
jgi:short-subunit dehydrogenase